MEKNYDFKEKLLQVHKIDRRDQTLLPTENEFALFDGMKIFVANPENKVILTAARDFQNYLFDSMNISASLVKTAVNADMVITLGENLGEAEGYMGYRVEVEKDGVKITAHDERGAAQALYYLEDVMNIRKAPYLAFGKTERKALFTPRIVQSPFGMYEYPDEAFQIMAHLGYDAVDIWLKDAHTDNRGYYIDLRLLSERAEKYGIDLYIQLYAPHSKHPDDEGAQEFYDKLYGELFSVCPKLKGVTLIGEANQFASRDPAVGKTPYGENFVENIPTGKISPGWWPCKDYPEWAEMVTKSIRKYRADAEVIFSTYNWGYAPEKERVALIEKLPKDITLMATWDMFHQYKIGESTETVFDYSLAFVGPGEYFVSEAIAAKKRGIKLMANSQTAGRTWDFGVVPYEPMAQRWIERYEKMKQAHKELGLASLLESIHYGFYPSIISEISKQAFFTEVEPLEVTMKKLLKRDFGENASCVESAMGIFSEAITHYIPNNEDMYGAFRIGPAYPLWSGVLEGLPATIPGQGKKPTAPYAMFGNWIYFGVYTPDSDGKNSLPGVRLFEEISSIEKMEKLFCDGIAVLEEVTGTNEAFDEVLGIAKFMRNSCRTTIAVKKHYALKQRLSIVGSKAGAAEIIDEMEGLLLAERENTLDTLPLVQANSRLGFEPSMEYTTDEAGLLWKVRQLDYELTVKLPTYRKANAL